MLKSDRHRFRQATTKSVAEQNAEPFKTFRIWFEQASKHPAIKEANAMNLATVSTSGRPSNRMVLMKDYDLDGFVFYTNLNSHKGEDLRSNSAVSLCFYWEPLGKQIRIEGFAKPVSDKVANQYFASRPRGSQIGAWASIQSQPMNKPTDLAVNIVKQTAQFGAGPIPRPAHWSGFNVDADIIEFWERGKFRAHSQVQYVRVSNREWRQMALYP